MPFLFIHLDNLKVQISNTYRIEDEEGSWISGILNSPLPWNKNQRLLWRYFNNSP